MSKESKFRELSENDIDYIYSKVCHIDSQQFDLYSYVNKTSHEDYLSLYAMRERLINARCLVWSNESDSIIILTTPEIAYSTSSVSVIEYLHFSTEERFMVMIDTLVEYIASNNEIFRTSKISMLFPVDLYAKYNLNFIEGGFVKEALYHKEVNDEDHYVLSRIL